MLCHLEFGGKAIRRRKHKHLHIHGSGHHRHYFDYRVKGKSHMDIWIRHVIDFGRTVYIGKEIQTIGRVAAMKERDEDSI